MTQTEALAKLDALVMEATRGCGSSGLACTAAITSAVTAWCLWMGAQVVTPEHPLPYQRMRGGGATHSVNGKVDVVATWASGPSLAIEIDRTHKRNSMHKLALAQKRGFRVLWLRWDQKNRTPGIVPDGITTHRLKIAEPAP